MHVHLIKRMRMHLFPVALGRAPPCPSPAPPCARRHARRSCSHTCMRRKPPKSGGSRDRDVDTAGAQCGTACWLRQWCNGCDSHPSRRSRMLASMDMTRVSLTSAHAAVMTSLVLKKGYGVGTGKCGTHACLLLCTRFADVRQLAQSMSTPTAPSNQHPQRVGQRPCMSSFCGVWHASTAAGRGV